MQEDGLLAGPLYRKFQYFDIQKMNYDTWSINNNKTLDKYNIWRTFHSLFFQLGHSPKKLKKTFDRMPLLRYGGAQCPVYLPKLQMILTSYE